VNIELQEISVWCFYYLV